MNLSAYNGDKEIDKADQTGDLHDDHLDGKNCVMNFTEGNPSERFINQNL